MNQISDLQSKIQDRSGSDAYSKQIRENLQEQLSAVKQQLREFNAGAKDIFNPKQLANTVITGDDDGKKKTKELDELQKIHAKIADLIKEAYTADESRIQAIQKEIAGLQEQEKKLISIRDLVTGKSESKELAIVNNYDSGSVLSGQVFIDQLKADLAQSNIDADMARLSQLMTDGLRAGLESQDLTGISTELKRRIMEGGDVPDDVWQELEEYIQENLDDANFTLSIDFNSKQIEEAAKKQKKDAKEMAQDWRAAGSAISAVGSAMQQIEDPAAKVLGTIAQAVATMALSYAQAAASPAVTSTGWGWIAFAATGVATMLSSIAAIKNATSGFANGGIVPGNSFSGDNLRTADYGINAGELVLNKAQQGNLASQLEGGELGDLQLDTRVSAEDIIFILNNNANRRGYRPFIND